MFVTLNRPKDPSVLFTLRDVVLAILALSGYVYYSYKFGTPDLGNNDFYDYQKMVEHPFDFSAAPASFVIRQAPTAFAYILYAARVFYDTMTATDLIGGTGFAEKRIFFALILSNAVAVAATLVIGLHYLRASTGDNRITLPFCYLGITLSYFYFPFSIIAPLATGWGWLTSTILCIGLLERRLLLIVLGAVLALVTRETILIFATVLAIAAWVTGKERFFVRSAFVLVLAGLALVVARSQTIIGHEHQMDVVSNVRAFDLSMAYLKWAILPQAIPVVLLAALWHKQRRYALILLVAMGAMILVGVATDEGPGIGRALGETLPIYAIIFILAEFKALPAIGHEGAMRQRSRVRAQPSETPIAAE
jgi:hypothetical protein